MVFNQIGYITSVGIVLLSAGLACNCDIGVSGKFPPPIFGFFWFLCQALIDNLFQTSCNIAALKHARLCGGREPEQRTGTKNDGVGAGPGWLPPLPTAPARCLRAPACCRGRGHSHCSPSHSRHGPLLRPAAGIGARPSACRCLVRRHLPPPSWPAASAHGRPAAATAAAVAGAAVPHPPLPSPPPYPPPYIPWKRESSTRAALLRSVTRLLWARQQAFARLDHYGTAVAGDQ